MRELPITLIELTTVVIPQLDNKVEYEYKNNKIKKLPNGNLLIENNKDLWSYNKRTGDYYIINNIIKREEGEEI